MRSTEFYFDPVEFYYLASKLFESSKDEIAVVRTCIGRAYYAAHLTAREKANIKDTGAGVHEAVIQHYNNRKPSIANRLKSLRKLRQHADYELRINITKKDSGSALQQSKEILVALGKIE